MNTAWNTIALLVVAGALGLPATDIKNSHAFSDIPPLGGDAATECACEGTDLSQFETCHTQFPGDGPCLDIATAFNAECRSKGISSWTWIIGPNVTGLDVLLGRDDNCSGHALNIVEYCYPGPFRKFCYFDAGAYFDAGVTNPISNLHCWIGETPTPPSWIVTHYIDTHMDKDCIAKFGIVSQIQ
jgi:hypothetical protein